ncbi:hypothetical protein HK097_002018 [Rhizophlyctis rosea]|uniref:Uncharacterized protein n=1 Tax=Rhizophlyctis rosea TaxID=64517 RepID=A0AAD5SIQ6_9FUNG|nr:hypothetical protein HK097_002018 [Rhizophlyctis rosea]
MNFASSQQGVKTPDESEPKSASRGEFPRPPKYSVAERMVFRNGGSGHGNNNQEGQEGPQRRASGTERNADGERRERGERGERGGHRDRANDRDREQGDRERGGEKPRRGEERQGGRENQGRADKGAAPLAIPKGKADGSTNWRDETTRLNISGSPAKDSRLSTSGNTYGENRFDMRADNRRRRDHQPEWMNDSKPKDKPTSVEPKSPNDPSDNYNDDIQRFKARMRAQEKAEKAAAGKAEPNGTFAEATPTTAAPANASDVQPTSDAAPAAAVVSSTAKQPDGEVRKQDKPPIDQLFGSSEQVDITKFFFDDLDVTSPASIRPAGPARKASESSRSRSRFFQIFEEQSSLQQKQQPSPFIAENDDPIARFLANNPGGSQRSSDVGSAGHSANGGSTPGVGTPGVGTPNEPIRDPLQQLFGFGGNARQGPVRPQQTHGAPVHMPSEEDIIRSMKLASKPAPAPRMMSEDELLQSLGANRPAAAPRKEQAPEQQNEQMAFGRVMSMLARGVEQPASHNRSPTFEHPPPPRPVQAQPNQFPIPKATTPVPHPGHRRPYAPSQEYQHPPSPQQFQSEYQPPRSTYGSESVAASSQDASSQLAALVQSSINAKKGHAAHQGLGLFGQRGEGAGVSTGPPPAGVMPPQHFPPHFGRIPMGPNFLGPQPPLGPPPFPGPGGRPGMPGPPFLPPPNMMPPGPHPPPPHFPGRPMMFPGPGPMPPPPFGMPIPGPGMGKARSCVCFHLPPVF